MFYNPDLRQRDYALAQIAMQNKENSMTSPNLCRKK